MALATEVCFKPQTRPNPDDQVGRRIRRIANKLKQRRQPVCRNRAHNKNTPLEILRRLAEDPANFVSSERLRVLKEKEEGIIGSQT